MPGLLSFNPPISKAVSLLLSSLFSLGGLPNHPQNDHSWKTSFSFLVWPFSYGLSGLGGPTRCPPA